MDTTVISSQALQTPRNRPLYPTYAESWGVLGWYLLAVFGVAVPVFLLANKLLNEYKLGVVMIATQVAQLGLVWLLIRARKARVVAVHWRGRHDSPTLYATVVVVTLAMLAARLPLDWVGIPEWNLERNLLELTKQPALGFVMLCVLAPLCEEWLFRGLLLPGLMRNYGPTRAILQTSLLFGIIHFNPAQAAGAAVLGVLLGWLYYRTRSLSVCVALHAVNNFVAWVVLVAMRDNSKLQQQLDATETPSLALALAALAGVIIVAVGVRYIHRLTEPSFVAETTAAEVPQPVA